MNDATTAINPHAAQPTSLVALDEKSLAQPPAYCANDQARSGRPL